MLELGAFVRAGRVTYKDPCPVLSCDVVRHFGSLCPRRPVKGEAL